MHLYAIRINFVVKKENLKETIEKNNKCIKMEIFTLFCRLRRHDNGNAPIFI